MFCQDGYVGDLPVTAPATPEAAQWDGFGTALKPAWEAVLLCQKPLEGTYAANVPKWGCGGLNIAGCRIGTEQTKTIRSGHSGDNGIYGSDSREFRRANPPGRWPANVMLDEAAAAMLDEQSGVRPGFSNQNDNGACETSWFGGNTYPGHREGYNDTGGASRFFYRGKCSRNERESGLKGVIPCHVCGGIDTDYHIVVVDGAERKVRCVRNPHPTVKPVAVMRWLCRLVTPPGGTILDPFMGSGSCGIAAKLEGFDYIGIELDPEYVAIAEARIAAWQPGSKQDEKTRPDSKPADCEQLTLEEMQ